MADIYIDPTVVGPGSGSSVDPYKALPAISANNRYLFKRGTTYALGATISIFSANVTFGAYGTGDRPKIDLTGRDIGFSFATSSSNGIVENLEIFGASRVAATDPVAVYASATANGLTVRNCVIHDIAGLNCAGVKSQSTGTGNSIVEDCDLYSIDNDAIIMNCTAFVIRRCRMWDLARDLTNASGDGIQAFLAAGPGLGAFVIEDCLVDHRDRNIKQCIIVQDQGGGSGGVIRRNVLIAANQDLPYYSANRMKALYVEQPSCVIEQNVVLEGEWGIYVHSSNSANAVVRSNIVLQTSALSLIGIQIAGNNGMQAYNNACVRLAGADAADSVGVSQYSTGLTGTAIKNNVVVGYKHGIRAGVYDAATVSNNDAYRCTNALVDASYAAQTAAASITTDPLFVDSTRPWLGLKPGSPCQSAGAYIQGAKDRFGRRYINPPNIGPWAVIGR